jgi:hypothetical protein
MCGAVDLWHEASKPFVDNPLGRMVVNTATGGLSAPAFAVYDVANGKDPLQAAIGGAAGYYGGDALNGGLGDMFGAASGVAPTVEGLGEMSAADTSTLLGAENAAPAYVPQADMAGLVGPTGTPATAGGSFWDRATGAAGDAMGKQWSAEGVGKTLGSIGPLGLASGLAGVYQKNQQAAKQKAAYDQTQASINSMYAPGSPEYNALWQQLSRADAAGGRNSSVGVRSVDLAAKIAQIKAGMLGQNLPTQYGMLNNSLSNSNSGLAGLFSLAQKANTPNPGPPVNYNIYTQPQQTL